MEKDSALESVVKSPPFKRLIRTAKTLAVRTFSFGWIFGLTYGYMVWRLDWPVLWVAPGFILLLLVSYAAIDYGALQRVKDWLSEEKMDLKL